MIYKELDLDIDKEYLLKVSEDNKKDKLSQYKIKNAQGEIPGTRDYYEMYFTFKEGKDLFYEMLPYECRGYLKYAYIQYEMVVHKIYKLYYI